MLNFDESFYTGTLMNVAYQYLANNQQHYGVDFSNFFIQQHDLNNGPSTHANARNFHDYIFKAMQSTNGQPTASDEQIFRFVAAYVNEMFNIQMSNAQMQRPQSRFANQGGLGTGGGFGRQSGGFGVGGGFGNNGGFGVQRQQRPGSSSALRDDTIAKAPPVQVQSPTISPVPSMITPTPGASLNPTVINYVHNPLDDLSNMKDGVEFSRGTEKPNWGSDNPTSDNIVIMQKESLKTADQKYVIYNVSGFNRIYTSNELDVVNDFFDVAPPTFLAESFIFELFYNHVEIIDVPTDTFLAVQEAFLKALSRESTAYRSVIEVLNSMFHGPRMAMANYLVEHINRALLKCCRMASKPASRITFEQIEDLDELLGTNFNHPILEIPNARSALQDIVNNAIKSALSGYTTPMFTSADDKMMPDIIRTSPAFPFAIPGVYPSKAIIPSFGDNEFKRFYDAFVDKVLSTKTYVRSIRSVIITNTMGQNELSKIHSKAERIFGVVAYFLSTYKTEYRGSISLGRNETVDFDETFKNDIPEQDYGDFITNPDSYISQMKSRFTEIDPPRHPVDRTLYAIQFKKSPREYIKAIDIVTTLDEPKENNRGIFVAKDIPALNLVK